MLVVDPSAVKSNNILTKLKKWVRTKEFVLYPTIIPPAIDSRGFRELTGEFRNFLCKWLISLSSDDFSMCLWLIMI